MDFSLTADQQQFVAIAAKHGEILQQEAPFANEQRRVQPQSLAVLKSLDCLGMLIPQEHEGRGADMVSYGLSLVEHGKADASAGLIASMHGYAMGVGQLAGVTEKARRRLYDVGRKSLVCAAISESQSTGFKAETFVPKNVTATKQDDGSYILHGKKSVVTGSRVADWIMVLAHLAGTEDTTVYLLLPMNAAGITVGSESDTAPYMKSASNNSVTFKQVRVEADGLIYQTDKFLEETVLLNGIRTFGYMAVYVGLYIKLLTMAMTKLTTRKVEGESLPLAYLPRVVSGMYECGRLGRVAYDALVKALWKYDQRPRTQPEVFDMMLAMCDAKAAIDALVPATFWKLNTFVGNTGMNDPHYTVVDMMSASLMAPTPDVVSETGGAIMMGLDMTRIPTIH